MHARLRTLALAAAIVAPVAMSSAQRSEQTAETKWSDQIAAGRWTTIKNLNGAITVGQATGSKVEVTATKRWRRGNPDDVKIITKKEGDDIVICALWDDESSCDDSNHRRNRNWGRDNDDDVSVDFAVLIPRGTKLSAGSVNGGVTVTGATADVEVNTVNGDVRVESGAGPLTARTVNGAVRARITAESVTAPMDFSTVNGRVIAELPANLGADLTMTTVNGDLQSDYDMVVRGRIDPHHLSVHLGTPGGPRISLTTVNGDVEIRKR